MIGRISGVTYWEGACEIRDASNQVVGEATWNWQAMMAIVSRRH